LIQDVFSNQFGRKPELSFQAPGRVNLIGEHTDYNQGFVLPLAIEQTTQVAVSKNNDQIFRIYSKNADELVQANASLAKIDLSTWAKYPLAVIQLLEIGDQGLDIAISSEVPIGAGLSSSAALECSVASAVNELLGLGKGNKELAFLCQKAENTVIGAPTGNMDQLASLFAEIDKAVFIDCQTNDLQLVELGFDQAGLELMVIDTRTSHDLADGDYGNRRNECFSAAQHLGVSSLRQMSIKDLDGIDYLLSEIEFKRVRHVVYENARVLEAVQAVNEKDFQTLGRLMVLSHKSMRDDFEISTPELDEAVEVAMNSSALGARMTGGGFGGSAIALVKTENKESLTDAIYKAFEAKGFKNPNIFNVIASAGAHQLQEQA